MRYVINVPRGAGTHSYSLLQNSDYQTIDIDRLVYMEICKIHDHRYDLQAFFYRTKTIISCRSYSTKKELYGAIQKLLQEKL